jgi:hypothetical protein
MASLKRDGPLLFDWQLVSACSQRLEARGARGATWEKGTGSEKDQSWAGCRLTASGHSQECCKIHSRGRVGSSAAASPSD